MGYPQVVDHRLVTEFKAAREYPCKYCGTTISGSIPDGVGGYRDLGARVVEHYQGPCGKLRELKDQLRECDEHGWHSGHSCGRCALAVMESMSGAVETLCAHRINELRGGLLDMLALFDSPLPPESDAMINWRDRVLRDVERLLRGGAIYEHLKAGAEKYASHERFREWLANENMETVRAEVSLVRRGMNEERLLELAKALISADEGDSTEWLTELEEARMRRWKRKRPKLDPF